jgi:hypothetical protein
VDVWIWKYPGERDDKFLTTKFKIQNEGKNMARNRRRVEGEMMFSWLALRLLLFALVVGFLLGITLLKRRNLKLGDESGRLDRELEQARKDTATLEGNLARCKTPGELEKKVAAWRLGMMHPSESQIRRLRDPEGGGDEGSRSGMLAQASPMNSNSRAR